jgi:Transketolase, thiamine diphosphate binding domain
MVEHPTADSPRPDLVVHRAPDQPATGGMAGDSIDTARFLAIDAVERAKSGHPGTPMGLAPLMYRPYTRHLRHMSAVIAIASSHGATPTRY